MFEQLKEQVETAWDNRELLSDEFYKIAITETIELLDKGELRCAYKKDDGTWEINEWVKKAVILYFSVQEMQVMELPPFEYYDKIPLKKGFDRLRVRVVPPATARYGSYLAPGVILMPSYVNIGAYVDEGTMIDTWATVGSCAQIGKNVHISGGVGIGGVLEPVQAKPVIIEDNVFIGSRSVIVEGVYIQEGAVIGANVVLTASTKIFDVTKKHTIMYRGFVPANSVVIPGTYPKRFNSGTYNVPCALIIGKRKESTDKKTSLNETLREFNIEK